MLPGLPEQPIRIAICHAPFDGHVVSIFAAGPQPDFVPQLWRRETIDGAFVPCALPPDLISRQADYDWFAAVAPNNPDILYLGAYDVHRGIRSPSGAWDWSNLSSKTGGDCIHADQHAIAFDPYDPGVLYIGCDGGIFRSGDEGYHWESLNRGLCITEFEFVAQHPYLDAWLLGGTQDNGALRYEGGSWLQCGVGDGGDCGVNALEPNVCYFSHYGVGLYRSTTGGGWSGWEWIGPDVEPEQNRPDGALFYPPMAVCGNVVAQAGATVFIRTEESYPVPRSPWVRVALPAGERASALVFGNAGCIYAGTDRGNIYRIEKKGGLWQAPSLIREAGGVVSDLHFTAGEKSAPDRLWVAFTTGENYLIRIDNPTDDDPRWVSLSRQMPSEFQDTPVNAIEVNPRHPEVAYAGLDTGVLKATDATGENPKWELFSKGLPNTLVKELALHTKSNLLRAATQSRGMWEIDLTEPASPAAAPYLAQHAVDTGGVRLAEMGGDNPFLRPGSSIFWWQSPDIKADYLPFQTNSAAGVDFENFADDHGVGAWGLRHVNPRRGSRARLYVRLRCRRGSVPKDQMVRLYYTSAGLDFPDLPAGFWDAFEQGVPMPADSPWRAVVPEQTPGIQLAPDGSAIVSCPWNFPEDAPANLCFLAVTSRPDGKTGETRLRIRDLLGAPAACAVRNVAIVNPPTRLGQIVRSLSLAVRGEPGQRDLYVAGDLAARRLVGGFLVSNGLSGAAAQAGARLFVPDAATRAHMAKLSKSAESGAAVDWEHVYAPAEGPWLQGINLPPQATEHLVLLPKPDADPGHASVILRAS
jgi:hypothetical protein